MATPPLHPPSAGQKHSRRQSALAAIHSNEHFATSTYQETITALIEGNAIASKRAGPLTITYRPATAESAAIIAYGRPTTAGQITTAQSIAVAEAVKEICPDAIKKHASQVETKNGRTWHVARWELPTLGQQPLLIP